MRNGLKLIASSALMATPAGVVGCSSGRAQEKVQRESEHLNHGATVTVADAAPMSNMILADQIAARERLTTPHDGGGNRRR
jgi:hypothetical protein